MTSRLFRGTTREKRSFVLATIAIVIGGMLMLARHLDDWTLSASEDSETQPVYRSLAITSSQPLKHLEWDVYDFVHTFGAKTPADPDVVVLGIDEASLSLENSRAFPEDIEGSRPLQLMNEVYPWSREVYARVIERLVDAGAQTIVIDLIFPAPSGRHPEGDEVLRRCLDKYRDHVILAADVVTRGIQNGENESIQFPDESLIAQTWPPDKRIGLVSYWPDTDGVIRKARFRYDLDPAQPEKTLHSFAASTLLSQNRGQCLPNDSDFHYVRFGDSTNYPPISLHEIFVPSLWESNYGSGKSFAGKTVFLGTVALQQQDFQTTPVGKIAGVEIHAHVYAAAKAGQLLRGMPSWFSPVSIAAASMLAWFLISRFQRPVLVTGVLFGTVMLAFIGQMLLFNHAALVVNASTPILAFGMIGICGLSYDFLLEQRQKQALKRSIMRFHSADVAEQIVQHPETYHSIRQGAVRCIVILFSDIRGYTSMSEQLTAQQMVTQLNEYFERMVAVVFQRKGAVDKFIGDAMMAVWGRFRNDSREAELADDACQAVDAALAMRNELAALNKRWREKNITELAIGIGIHQGEAVVGEIGSQQRAELTAIGDCVNLGSRLEGATKEYGIDLLISDVVQQRVVSRFVCRSVDLLRVKGKTKPVEVFTVLGPCEMTPPPGLEHFEEAMRCYRHGRFDEALQLFQKAMDGGMDDYLTCVFVNRSSDMAKNPPESWEGVYTMTKK
ncbi:MAG: adenylate/guanylate cyclase domain-containing protein [Luteolibacter sp.]|uniref:adenylate/guanylate cyclase domain-containing protein n=1 Tax=Luteolibacter sp. TaxID=1962973 RepID=UPI003264B106